MQQVQKHTVVLSESSIADGVTEVAAKLNSRFQDVVAVVVVPGGVFFAADVLRLCHFNVVMDTVSCPHTPGERQNASPIVFQGLYSLANRDVILIDDAVESGGTMKRLVSFFQSEHAPRSVSVVTLFARPGRVDIGCEHYYAREVEEEGILVGYGLPWEGAHRNQPFISKR